MVDTENMPQRLTRDGVSKLCQSKDLHRDLHGVYLALQVIEVSLCDDSSRSEVGQRKRIKGKVKLSDGAKQIVAIVPDLVYAAMQSAGLAVRKFDVWVLNAGKQ